MKHYTPKEFEEKHLKMNNGNSLGKIYGFAGHVIAKRRNDWRLDKTENERTIRYKKHLAESDDVMDITFNKCIFGLVGNLHEMSNVSYSFLLTKML